MARLTSLIFNICSLSVSVMLASCSDFFTPTTDDEFSGDDGYTSNTEMYTGFLGIMTKVQAIGDKEILLTEPRGELIEPCDGAPGELIALYQYDEDLQANSYANPQGYYEVVIACNDYLQNLTRYRQNPNVDASAWQALVASTLRVKVWVYKTLAEIYGQAVWFDDAITALADLGDAAKFQHLTLRELIDRCLATLDEGYGGVAADQEINWYEWLDPTHTVTLANSQYRKWNYIVPAYAPLYAELCLWKGALLDAAASGSAASGSAASGSPASGSAASGSAASGSAGSGSPAAAYYQQAADLLLQALGTQINVTADPGSNVYWLPSGATPGHYSPIWNNAQPYPYEAVSAIIYDYTYNQTNTLLRHFSNEYPNEYLLRPAQPAIDRFLDKTFNPGSSTNDTRYKCCFGISSGQRYLAKFRPVGSSVRAGAWQDDCHIYIYRAMQLHLMLCEALNHLKRFTAMAAVLNSGVKAGDTDDCFRQDSPEWKGFESTIDPTKCDWTGTANWGTRKYPSMGIRGCFGLTARPVKDNMFELGENGTYRYNDLALLDEAMLEFAGEGKVYPMMCRLAVRYADPAIVADRVCAKYAGDALAATVRTRIMNGGFWVPFELGL